MEIERFWAMPNKLTFTISPIQHLIYEELTDGLWLNPFANETKLYRENTQIIYNDLNPKFDVDYHLDALEFLKLYDDNSIDGVLFDPPYSLTQLKEVYDNIGKAITNHENKYFFSDIKKEISRVVKSKGKVISFMWNSNGIGKSLGFEIDKILLVSHGGIHNDTIVTVETKKQTMQQTLL